MSKQEHTGRQVAIKTKDGWLPHVYYIEDVAYDDDGLGATITAATHPEQPYNTDDE